VEPVQADGDGLDEAGIGERNLLGQRHKAAFRHQHFFRHPAGA
jgi:hypothetical protein